MHSILKFLQKVDWCLTAPLCPDGLLVFPPNALGPTHWSSTSGSYREHSLSPSRAIRGISHTLEFKWFQPSAPGQGEETMAGGYPAQHLQGATCQLVLVLRLPYVGEREHYSLLLPPQFEAGPYGCILLIVSAILSRTPEL